MHCYCSSGQINSYRRVNESLAMHRTAIGCWLSRGSRVLLLPMVIVMACSACLRSLPEWTPMKDASPAPGNAWKLRPDQLSAPLPTELLPGTPPALERFADKLSFPQLIDVALQTSPSARQAGGQARAAAAAWIQAAVATARPSAQNSRGFVAKAVPPQERPASLKRSARASSRSAISCSIYYSPSSSGLTRVGQYPFPLAGEGGDGWEEVRSSPPPQPSPIKGEGN
jgi:hypothetical protein